MSLEKHGAESVLFFFATFESMPTPFVPTYLLDIIIAAAPENGSMTLNELRTSQLASLAYDCPNCAATSGLITVTAADGTDHQVVDPLCGGMGKTAINYALVTDTTHWVPTPPPPDPVPPVDGP